MSSPYALTIRYSRTEGERAVFVLPDGQQLFWPLSSVPEHYTPGKTYTIGFDSTESSASAPRPIPTPSEQPLITPTKADHALAVALLEELFQKPTTSS